MMKTPVTVVSCFMTNIVCADCDMLSCKFLPPSHHLTDFHVIMTSVGLI